MLGDGLAPQRPHQVGPEPAHLAMLAQPHAEDHEEASELKPHEPELSQHVETPEHHRPRPKAARPSQERPGAISLVSAQ